ncbi:PTS system, Lactose/Cellobiose specific IIA subunit [Clostridiales bacterium oral taxon 876 str. F0540]|nr:PTS system, Lactose/Cellobiose specific IIA subunit [Clostridiales bacterium oral taxon 876 str. F0540]
MEDNEQSAFKLILHSGNARSLAYEGLGLIKSGKKEEGLALYNEAKKELLEAQKKHSEFLHRAVTEQQENVPLLLIHAEDHISSSQVVVELVKEIMDLYGRLGDKSE